MAKLKQSDSGKAWEYGLARVVADVLSVPLVVNNPHNVAQNAYGQLEGKARDLIDKVASEAFAFLKRYDSAFNDAVDVVMQADTRGKEGDVRDLIVRTSKGGEVGISAKHRHKAVKHPRLSPQIDFGAQWYMQPCSDDYRRSVAPIWDKLLVAKDGGKMWRDIPDKVQTIYAPVVRSFMAEVRSAPAEKLLLYMLGKYDFYKVVKDNGSVLLQSFNLGGSLGWGPKLPMPRRIIDVEQVRDSTAIVYFDSGWSLSFRLHSAESKVTSSLKFDVNLEGIPSVQATHTIPYR